MKGILHKVRGFRFRQMDLVDRWIRKVELERVNVEGVMGRMRGLKKREPQNIE